VPIYYSQILRGKHNIFSLCFFEGRNAEVCKHIPTPYEYTYVFAKAVKYMPFVGVTCFLNLIGGTCKIKYSNMLVVLALNQSTLNRRIEYIELPI